jgi:hypothetical protein
MRYQVSRINYGLFKLFIRWISVYPSMRGAVRKLLCIKWFLWNHPPIFKPTEKRLSARLSNKRWHGWFSSDESSTAVTLLATVHARSNEMLSCFFTTEQRNESVLCHDFGWYDSTLYGLHIWRTGIHELRKNFIRQDKNAGLLPQNTRQHTEKSADKRSQQHTHT